EAGPVALINRLPNIASFDHLYENALDVDVQGISICIAAIEDLIRLKTGTNRERDRMHVTMLETLKDLTQPEDDKLT
ncbi:MAG TPA: hypothetical protein PKA27_16515, partial [Fimbriimonadaceae bacterium]|nr:hypothetical protein [Fimbriimonadaceae bacterium]